MIVLLIMMSWAVVLMLWIFAPELREIVHRLKKTKELKKETKPLKGLSVPAKQLYKEYMALPAESRPFPDIIPVLRGLDVATAHDPRGRLDHFDASAETREYAISRGITSRAEAYNIWPRQFAWMPTNPYGCKDRNGQCDFHDYYFLHVEIEKVKKEIQATERTLSAQANQQHLDVARELMQQLRNEQSIQREVRKELGT